MFIIFFVLFVAFPVALLAGIPFMAAFACCMIVIEIFDDEVIINRPRPRTHIRKTAEQNETKHGISRPGTSSSHRPVRSKLPRPTNRLSIAADGPVHSGEGQEGSATGPNASVTSEGKDHDEEEDADSGAGDTSFESDVVGKCSDSKGFVFHDKLGKGRYGAVYRARYVNRGPHSWKPEKGVIAIKLLHPPRQTDGMSKRHQSNLRYHSEVYFLEVLASHQSRLQAAGLKSLQRSFPEIAPNFCGTIMQSDVHWIAMEYLAGGNLNDWRAQRDSVSEPQACSVFDHLLEAVSSLHALGLIHTDIHPGNVMFDARGNLKLIDFGRASPGPRAIRDTEPSPSCWLDPCRVQGELSIYTTMSDIYSIGMILQWLIMKSREPSVEMLYELSLHVLLIIHNATAELSQRANADELRELVQAWADYLKEDPKSAQHNSSLIPRFFF